MKYDPMASLYGLLEVESAAKFEDQSVPGVQLDLSLGRFMLLANKADGLIPEPILSRVRTFHIQSPTADEMRAIAQRIYKSLRTKYELNLQPILSRSVLDEVVNLSPREVKTRLEAGIAIAAAEGKRELDLTSWRLTACEGSVKKTRMGYL
jgi:ATP-dependent Lon protease